MRITPVRLLAAALAAGSLAGGAGYAMSRPPAASAPGATLTAANGAQAAAAPRRGHGAGMRLRALIGLVADQTLQTRAQVLAQLRAGKSLDQIAGSQAGAVRRLLIAKLTARLHNAVVAGRITQAQADKRLAAWTSALTTLMATPGTALHHPGARPGRTAAPRTAPA